MRGQEVIFPISHFLNSLAHSAMFIEHKRNRRAVDRANMSSDYQKERPSENEGRQINTTAHKHRPMCEQLGFGRLPPIVKGTI